MARWVLFFVMGVSLVGAWLVSSSAEAQPRRRAPAVVQRAPERVCIPGAQVGCACVNGGRGVQLCASDGMGFDACRCLPAPHERAAEAVASAPATAPAPPVTAPAAEPSDASRRSWYGWETLLSDAGALAWLSISRVGNAGLDDWTTILGIALFELGAPLAHARRGHPARAFGSLAYRVFVPAAGVLVGWAIGTRITDDPNGQALAITLVGGAAVASAVVLDAAVWAYHDSTAPRRAAPRAMLSAGLTPVSGGALVLVGGTM